MSIEDEMNIDERRKYLHKMKKRYSKVSRKEKGKLLDEMEAVIGMDRKTLIRLLNGNLQREPRRKQRGRYYGPEVDDALRVIDESFDYICAERLTPNLVWMAHHLDTHGELRATPTLLEQLGQISISTVRRRQCRIRRDIPRLPRKKPRGRKLTQDIPMLRLPWTLSEPGQGLGNYTRGVVLSPIDGQRLRDEWVWRFGGSTGTHCIAAEWSKTGRQGRHNASR